MQLLLKKTKVEIIEGWPKIQDFSELANFLEVDYNTLNFYYHKTDNYKEFKVRKKTGGYRTIHAPVSPLKIIQRKISQVLNEFYYPPAAAQSFIKDRSIVKNAKKHLQKKNVFNIDLKNFFPSIHFRRVVGMLEAYCGINKNIASKIAHLCTYRGAIPQGTPSSPIISNIICRQLDKDLTILARDAYCTYSRFADDITFSNDKQILPKEIVDKVGNPGEKLSTIISHHDFKINKDKVRLQKSIQRQIVTGVVVNDRPNLPRKEIKKVRAILHNWSKTDYQQVQSIFLRKYFIPNQRNPQKNTPTLKVYIEGKLAYIKMLRGARDPVYLKLLKKFYYLTKKKFPYDKDFQIIDNKLLREKQESIKKLVNKINDLYLQIDGEHLIKYTGRGVKNLDSLGQLSYNLDSINGFIKKVYQIFIEGPGSKVRRAIFKRALHDADNILVEINSIRTDEQHDVEHGKPNKIRKKKEAATKVYKKYTSKNDLSAFSELDYYKLQLGILISIEKALNQAKKNLHKKPNITFFEYIKQFFK